jgi:TPR repeat protein
MLKNANGKKGAGEDIYQRALQLMKEADDYDEEKENERSNMMYEAYQKSKERELNPKSQGVTVVRTLVKEVRKDRTKKKSSSIKRDEAVELLKQAANDFNHPDAAIQLGNMLLKMASRSIIKKDKKDGSDPKALVSKAVELFRQAGDAGSRVGWYNLGHLLWTGFPPIGDAEDASEEQNGSAPVDKDIEDIRIIVPDMEEAMNSFSKAIELGDSDAMYLVGVHLLGQEDLESNLNGMDLIERAADTGHDGALYYLALFVSRISPVATYIY